MPVRKVIGDTQIPKEVHTKDLEGNEIIVYRKHDSDNVAMLCKLRKKGRGYNEEGSPQGYGFVCLNHPDNEPTYTAANFFEAVQLALKNRKLFAFDNAMEMFTALTKGEI